MTDVFRLAGPALGAQVVNFCTLLLRCQNNIRFFESSIAPAAPLVFGSAAAAAAPAGSPPPMTVERVMSFIDGTYTEQHRGVVQRESGTDIDRMLRAPVVIYSPHTQGAQLQSFPAAFLSFLAVHTNAHKTESGACFCGQREFFDEPSDAGSAPLFFPVVFTCSQTVLIDKLFASHLTCHTPTMLEESLAPADREYTRIVYLTAVQKLAFLLLYIHTTDTRKVFEAELKFTTRPSVRSGEPSWLDPTSPVRSAILQSIRLRLFPFVRWLCVGHGSLLAEPITSKLPEYIPVSEDNCSLTRHFGRIFSSLISIEVVHFQILNEGGGIFASSQSQDVFAEQLDNINSVLVPVFWFYFRLAQWKSAEESISSPFTFFSFIRLGMQFTFSNWEFKLPESARFARGVFEELKDAVLNGTFSEQRNSCFYKIMRATPFISPDVHPCSQRMVMRGFLQIAKVIERFDAVDAELQIRYSNWFYTPVRYIDNKFVRRLQPHMVPSIPARAQQDEAVLIQSNCAKHLEGLIHFPLSTLRDFPVAYQIGVGFYDVTHPCHTNSEVWCVALMNNAEQTMRYLKIYMYAASLIFSEPKSSKPWDEQTTLSYAGALACGGIELFHWINAFRLVVRYKEKAPRSSPYEKKKQVNRQIDLDLDEEEEEKDDGVFDTNKPWNGGYLSAAGTHAIADIISSPTFIPSLLKEAARETQQTGTDADGDPVTSQSFVASAHLLDLVPWLLSEHFCITVNGLLTLHSLHPGNDFKLQFENSGSYSSLTEAPQEWLTQSFDEVGGTMLADHAFFDSRPVIFTDDLHDAPFSQKHQEPFPQLLMLDRGMVAWLMQSVAKDIGKNKVDSALQKLGQLKAFANITRAKAKLCVDFTAPRLDAITLVHKDDATLFSGPAVATVQGKAKSVNAIINQHFGATGTTELEGDVFIPALLKQRLFAPRRSEAEIMLPLNQQHSMFNSALLKAGMTLIEEELASKPPTAMSDFAKATAVLFKRREDTLSASPSPPAPIAAAAAAPVKAKTAHGYKRQALHPVGASYTPGTHNWKPPTSAAAQYSPTHDTPTWRDDENRPPTSNGMNPYDMSEFEARAQDDAEPDPQQFDAHNRAAKQASGSKRKHA